MKTHARWPIMALTLLAVILFAAGPARADFCLQLNGGALSGDLGFFRFIKKLPKKSGAMAPLTGRVAGLSPAFGTAVFQVDGSGIELAATFFADGVEGQFDVFLTAGSGFTSGGGDADYGAYGANISHTANIVDCALEP